MFTSEAMLMLSELKENLARDKSILLNMKILLGSSFKSALSWKNDLSFYNCLFL